MFDLLKRKEEKVTKAELPLYFKSKYEAYWYKIYKWEDGRLYGSSYRIGIQKGILNNEIEYHIGEVMVKRAEIDAMVMIEPSEFYELLDKAVAIIKTI